MSRPPVHLKSSLNHAIVPVYQSQDLGRGLGAVSRFRNRSYFEILVLRIFLLTYVLLCNAC